MTFPYVLLPRGPTPNKKRVSPGYDSHAWGAGERPRARLLPLGPSKPVPSLPPASLPCGPFLRQIPGTSYLHLSVRINQQFEAPLSLVNVSSKLHALAPGPPGELFPSERADEPSPVTSFRAGGALNGPRHLCCPPPLRCPAAPRLPGPRLEGREPPPGPWPNEEQPPREESPGAGCTGFLRTGSEDGHACGDVGGGCGRRGWK